MTSRRNLILLAGFALAGLAAGLGLSIAVPPRYHVSAVVAIADVGTAASPDLRLPVLERALLSPIRLESVARALGPDVVGGEAGLAHAPSAEDLRRDVRLRVRGAGDLEIRYSHADPATARDVVELLTSSLVETTLPPEGSRSEEFLLAEPSDPELVQMKRRIEETQAEIDRLRSAPVRSASPAELRTQQLALRALDAEIRAAESRLEDLQAGAHVPDSAPLESPAAKASDELRAELATLRSRYTDEHPDVQRLLARLRQAEEAEASSTRAPQPVVSPTEVALAMERVEELRARRGQVLSALRRAEADVDRAQRSEEELPMLARELRDLQEAYVERLAERPAAEEPPVEAAELAPRFRLVTPARWPRDPSFPSRGLFAMIGALAGLTLGAGVGRVLTRLDDRVRGESEVEELLQTPQLASLPEIRVSRRERSSAPPA